MRMRNRGYKLAADTYDGPYRATASQQEHPQTWVFWVFNDSLYVADEQEGTALLGAGLPGPYDRRLAGSWPSGGDAGKVIVTATKVQEGAR